MTVSPRAREALADCERAVTDYEAGARTPFLASRWVGLITLLRLVGHVLEKVDGPAASAEIQQRMSNAWKTLKASTTPETRIFHEFIEKDRNLTVKQYQVRARVNINLHPGAVWYNLRTGESGSDPSGPTTYEFSMRDGPFKGRDTRELCREAIEFWRQYLDAIDSHP
jgi:hypothetical protein